MSMRAAIYARVSTSKQEREGYSLPEQIDLCRQHIIQRSYMLVAEPFIDDSTGMDDDRPGLNALREAIRPQRITVIVITELDRLARRRVLIDLIEDELVELGARVDYVFDQFDDSDEGELFKDIKKAVAEYDRKKVLRRLRSGKIGKVKAGKVLLGERAPYGYRKAADGGLTIDEEEAAVVRLIFRWYLDGLLVRTIARKLGEEGYHKPRFHADRQRFEEWSHATIRKILSSEVYIGVWHFNKTRWVKVKDAERGKTITRNVPRPREEWIAVSVPAIIDPETFAAARLQAQQNEQYSPRNRRHEYVFSQMLRCDTCSSAYCGAKAKQGRARYVCRGTQRDPVKLCTMPDFYEPDLLAAIWPWFSNLLKNPEDVIAALNERNASQDAELQPLRDRLARLDRQIAETQQRIVNLRDRLETETDPEEREDLKARLARVKPLRTDQEQERAETLTRLDQQSYSSGQLDDIHTICQRWEGKLDSATPMQQRELLRLFRFAGRLAVENGEMVAHVTCELGSERLLIGNTTLKHSAA